MKVVLLLLLSFVLVAGLAASSCSTVIPNRDPVGERFPSVDGRSLEGDAVALPGDVAGGPTILILGYDMDAQFDADRWLFGLLQSETPARVLEVPTIPGLFASWARGNIDEGMRSGIPSEDWGVVVTVYGAQAREIVALTGTEGDRNVRVLLLDADGVVRWFHDRGFSAGKLLELDRGARELAGS